MSLWSSLNPVLQHYLAASLACLFLDAAVFEILFSGAEWQVHLARLGALGLVTGLFHATCNKLFLRQGMPPLETKKGKPLPLGILAIAGAILSFTVFTRFLPLLPDELAGRMLALGAGNLVAVACNFFLLHSMLPAKTTDPGMGLRPRTISSLIVWGLFLLIALAASSVMEHLRAILSFPDLRLPLGSSGPDSWLRLTQVRQWLTGTDFFSHAVAGTNAPYGGIETPWTRPMDALVAIFYFLTPSKHGIEKGLLMAAIWPSLVLAIGTVWVAAKTARLRFDSIHALAIGVMVFLVSPYAVFAAGDAGHYLLLLLLWSCCLWLLLSEDVSVMRGLALGAVVGAMIWTDPYALAFFGLVFALMATDAVVTVKKSAKLLAAATGSALVIIAALFVEMPAAIFLSNTAYDTLSVAHAALAVMILCACAIMTLAFRLKPSLAIRCIIAVTCGGGCLLAQSFLYPGFYDGPLAGIESSFFPDILARSQQFDSLFSGSTERAIRIMAIPSFAGFLLAAVLRRKNLRAARRRFLVLSSVLLAVTMSFTFVEMRWGLLVLPVSAFVLGALLPGYAGASNGNKGDWLKPLSRKWRPYLVIWGVYLFFDLASKGLGSTAPEPRLCPSRLSYAIQTGQLVKALGEEKLTVFVPPEAGGEILFFTPYHIIASGYPREFRGLRDIARVENAKTDNLARTVLRERDVDALFFCPGNYPSQSWLRETKTKIPEWLEPVEDLNFLNQEGEKPLLLRVKK